MYMLVPGAMQRRWRSAAAVLAPPVLRLGDERLRRRCRELELSEPSLPQVERELHAALEAFRTTNGYGRGISAPQIGHAVRMVACNLGSAATHRPGEQPFTLVNPEITWSSDETFTMWDDCMSFPDKMVRLRRHRSISLAYVDPATGERIEWQRMGQAEAELLQHELDHLDGVLAVDHADSEEAIVSREDYLSRRDAYDARVDYAIGSTIG